MPKVSIITPYYKAEKYIAKTIESVHNQTFMDWEYIIVDDGSPIPLIDIISSSIYSDKRVKVVQQLNGGQSKANNLGFSLTSKDSKYLLFLDADDYLEKEMLTILVNYLDNNRFAGAISCDYNLIDEQDNKIKNTYNHIRRYLPGFPGVNLMKNEISITPFISLFAFCELIPSATLLRRSSYVLTNGWNENLTIVCDTDLWLQLALLSEFHYYPEKLVRYRKHPNSLTSSNSVKIWQAEQKKLYRNWLVGEGLTKEEKENVKVAWHFKEGRLLPYLWFTWGIQELIKLNLIKASKHFLSSLRQIIIYYWKTKRGKFYL